MAVFEQFPYTNFHDLNLDKIITKVDQAAADAAASAADAAATAASIDAIAKAPSKAYKALTIAEGYMAAVSTNYTVPSGGDKFTGLLMAGGNLFLSLYGSILKVSKSFSANTYYKILSFDASAAQFLPEHFFAVFNATTDKGHPLIVFVAYGQTNFAEGDGVFIYPTGNFNADAVSEVILTAPAAIPFFSNSL